MYYKRLLHRTTVSIRQAELCKYQSTLGPPDHESNILAPDSYWPGRGKSSMVNIFCIHDLSLKLQDFLKIRWPTENREGLIVVMPQS